MKILTLILSLLACLLASCGIPPSPAVAAHAGVVGGGPAAMGMMGGSTINAEAQKSAAFWGR